MRVLLDECVSEQLRHHLPGHECYTVRYAGFAGLENGELLKEAEAAQFDVLLTVDKGLRIPAEFSRSKNRCDCCLRKTRSS